MEIRLSQTIVVTAISTIVRADILLRIPDKHQKSNRFSAK